MRVFIPGNNFPLISEKNDKAHLTTFCRYELDIAQCQALFNAAMTFQPDCIVDYTAADNAKDDMIFYFEINRDGTKYFSSLFFVITSLLLMPLLTIYLKDWL